MDKKVDLRDENGELRGEKAILIKYPFGKKARLFIIGLIVGLLAGAITVGIFAARTHREDSARFEELDTELSTTKEALHKAYEKEQERLTVTDVKVWDRLAPIGELATYMYEYGNTKKVTNALQGFWGGDIPLTTNEVIFVYSGIIKVGIEMSKLKLTLDRDAMTITIKLPDPEVLDNYINVDKMECVGSNNIFNPIDVGTVPDYLSDFAQEELASAKAQGLFDSAVANTRTVISDLLSVFEEYTVVFE